MKVAIFAIGTEVTDGEILNANATSLADKLTQLNFRVSLHIAVPDELGAIADAIEFSSQSCELLVFTGGLGPTIDDLTRQAVADWTNCTLEFNDSEYEKLLGNLTRKNRKPTLGHKKQCMFPKGSEIIENPVGTASAFFLSAKSRYIACLPGPPKEIIGVWQKGLEVRLRLIAPKNKLVLKRWTCEGTGESEIANIVEKIFANSHWELGFRASHPQVHVKLWIPEAEMSKAQPFIEQVNDQLSQWLIAD